MNALREFLRPALLLLAAGGLMTGAAAAALTDATSDLFSGSGNCAFCHDQWGRGLTSARGEDVSIGTDWRATMMAHAFKDPLWRAAMEVEVARRPAMRGFIEDKCQTCHAPMARSQAAHEGTNGLAYAVAKASPLAGDGVSCTVCHQVRPGNLGSPESFSGRYTITHLREIYGPYPEPLAMPMRRHVDYTPVQGAHTQDSGLCATCHTLFTPIFDSSGRVTGEFPEQVPYLEWRRSAHASEGRHCQDCHLQRLDEPVRISSRPPWLEPRQPFWRHQLVGGNAFMLSLLQRHADALEASADAGQFAPLITRAREQLSRAATLNVRGQRRERELVLRVAVENRAGHKFPTGHPYRRAWLQVRVADAAGRVVFVSGEPDAAGRLRLPPAGFAPHHEVITSPDQVQVYEAVLGDAAGRPTKSLLEAVTYLKDNRLPPRGFRAEGPDAAAVAVHGGAADDRDFNRRGSGRDEVTYRIAVDRAAGPLEVGVTLVYQPVPPEVVEFLTRHGGAESRRLGELYRTMSVVPDTVQHSHLKL